MTIEFQLEGDYIPLIQLLKVTGLALSGGEAQTVVEQGLVHCNGRKEDRKRLKVKRGDKIEFNHHTILVN